MGSSDPTDLSPREATQIKKRIPFLALCLSLLTPGLGQIYDGRLLRGAMLAVMFAVVLLPFFFVTKLLHTFPGLLLFLAAFVALCALCIFTIVDAFRGAFEAKEFTLRRYNRWYVYIGIAAMFHFFVSWLPDFQEPGDAFHNYVIVGDSMSPTLALKDRLFVDPTYYSARKPRAGEVIVFLQPDKPSRTVIERVVAVEGETVELKGKTVYVNGKRLADPWGHSSDGRILSAAMSKRDNMGLIRIPDGFVFVLGDNRDGDLDSRFFGAVERGAIRGKPLYIFWAKDKSRIGMAVK